MLLQGKGTGKRKGDKERDGKEIYQKFTRNSPRITKTTSLSLHISINKGGKHRPNITLYPILSLI